MRPADTSARAARLAQFGAARARRWAPFLGLAGQPAWIWHAIDAQAVGVLVVSAAYTVVWLAGCVSEMRR
ncbi:MAG TPA: hypothetical protein PLG77_03395 [Burkholderiaceae bacterium]|nr:hypothetical protein [Burkholderiaceae bacterium]